MLEEKVLEHFRGISFKRLIPNSIGKTIPIAPVSHRDLENEPKARNMSRASYFPKRPLKNDCISAQDFLSASALYPTGMLNFFAYPSASGLVKLWRAPG